METEGYGSTYENVSIIGGVITTGDSSAVSAGNIGVSGAPATSRALQNGAILNSAVPKSSSTEGVVGLAKKPVPKPRRISLLTTAEMTQGQGAHIASAVSSETNTAASTESTTSTASAAASSKILEENFVSALKLSPESAAVGMWKAKEDLELIYILQSTDRCTD